jgi:tetratricopeptide (TPR) repeat protein
MEIIKLYDQIFNKNKINNAEDKEPADPMFGHAGTINIAKSLIKEGSYAEAAECLEAYLQDSPGNTAEMNLLANCREKMEMFSEAKRIYIESLSHAYDESALKALVKCCIIDYRKNNPCGQDIEPITHLWTEINRKASAGMQTYRQARDYIEQIVMPMEDFNSFL